MASSARADCGPSDLAASSARSSSHDLTTAASSFSSSVSLTWGSMLPRAALTTICSLATDDSPTITL